LSDHALPTSFIIEVALKSRLCPFGICCVLLAAPPATAQTVEIWEIQGDGLSSPLEGQRVTTNDNVVTAVGEDLFFMQTPDSRSDGKPWTSDGIVVYVGGPPSVSVGDVVDVTGTVSEYYELTEIADNPTVTVSASGQPRPTAVTLDADAPSPLQPWPETELERFEGMWVEVQTGAVSAPSDGYGEACVAAGGSRLFREPGILWPGLPGLAVWDGNPEGFELDPYGLGGGGTDLAAGTVFRAEGVLSFDFGDYQLWPVTLETIAEPQLPRPAPTPADRELTVATQNLDRLGHPESDVPTETRLAKLSRHIREVLGSPHVLAVQEVVDLTTLEALADEIAADDSGLRYDAYLLEGNDYGGIDVGFLVRDPVEVQGVAQIGAEVRFTWDNSLLFDRPPLVLEATMASGDQEVEVTLVAVHLKSLSGIDDPVDGERVRQKRLEQSVWLSEWIQDRQVADSTEALIILGDFNAYAFSDGYVDVIGQVTGSPDPDGALLPASEEVEPVLVDWILGLPPAERYSFVFGCSAEDLDHILTNRVATPWVTGVAFGRGNVDVPAHFEYDPTTALRSSDHDGVVLFLNPGRSRGHRRDVIRRSRPTITR
jgi:predicted extracellular nuclease